MKILSIRTDRRTLLKGLAAIPFVALAGRHGRVEAEMVSVDDPVAKNLEYVETSAVAGQTCANCKLYTGGASAGGCPLFGTKQVTAGGWCKSWVAK
jgi:hypothetical protein